MIPEEIKTQMKAMCASYVDKKETTGYPTNLTGVRNHYSDGLTEGYSLSLTEIEGLRKENKLKESQRKEWADCSIRWKAEVDRLNKLIESVMAGTEYVKEDFIIADIRKTLSHK